MSVSAAFFSMGVSLPARSRSYVIRIYRRVEAELGVRRVQASRAGPGWNVGCVSNDAMATSLPW